MLTTDELKAFVDGLPPADADPPPSPDEESPGAILSRPIVSLRDLLARRLVRDGRLQEAQSYFSTKPPPMDPDVPAPSVDARAYEEALKAAQPAWPWQNVARAEALFTAATLARKRGLEIMGTEGPPDEAALGGNFEAGVGQTSPAVDRQRSPDNDASTPYTNTSLLDPTRSAALPQARPGPTCGSTIA